jgi:hypothetical protein
VKDAQLRRFLGLTWAGWLNVALQFTGFRLVRWVETDGDRIGEITRWQLRWAPIWRMGWSLPSLGPRLSDMVTTRVDPTPASPLAAFGPCTILANVSSPVQVGDSYDPDGRLRHAEHYVQALGVFLSSAPAGGTASVRLGDPPVDPLRPICCDVQMRSSGMHATSVEPAFICNTCERYERGGRRTDGSWWKSIKAIRSPSWATDKDGD